MLCERMLQAHPEYDVNVKVKILIGLVGDAAAVAVMLKRQPCIIGLSELTIQVRSVTHRCNLRDLSKTHAVSEGDIQHAGM